MAKLLVIDTETGGTDPLAHSLLSLGAAVWSDGEVGARVELFVAEEPLAATAEALEINRIDLATHCARAVRPSEAVTAFEAFVREAFRDEFARGEKAVLVGHNIGFDVGFLKRLYRLAGADFESTFSHRTLDTAGVLRFLSLAGLRAGTAADLTAALSELGISVEEDARHTALGDATATALLLTRLLALARSGGNRLEVRADQPAHGRPASIHGPSLNSAAPDAGS
jgi:DNA polymerase III subunit epsilon